MYRVLSSFASVEEVFLISKRIEYISASKEAMFIEIFIARHLLIQIVQKISVIVNYKIYKVPALQPYIEGFNIYFMQLKTLLWYIKNDAA